MNQISLPTGWCETTLSDIAGINPTTDKSVLDDDTLVSFVPMPAVEAENGQINVTQLRKFREVKKGYTPFKEGDVLFAKITPCMENGKMAVVPTLHNEVGFGSTEFHVLRPYIGVNSQFLYYFISSKSFRNEAEHKMTGAVGQKRVPTTYVEQASIKLPPSNEQKRIVSKIEELFSELDKGIESLKTARAQLKVYRQSILKHAFEGKLTADWRLKNSDKLKSDKELHQSIYGIVARNNIRKYREPQNYKSDFSSLPRLPKNWTWTELDNLVLESQNGISKRKGTVGIETVVLRLADISDFTLSQRSLRKILCDNREIASYGLVADDILVVRVNGSEEIVGKFIHYFPRGEEELFCDHFIRLRPIEQINAEYVCLYARSRHARNFIKEKKVSSAGQNTINQSSLLQMPIAMPSFEEQSQVVQEVQHQFSLLDHLAEIIESEINKSIALRQSILKKAFSGQLVAQDPTDEPASILLERIRAEKEKALDKKPKTKRRAA